VPEAKVHNNFINGEWVPCKSGRIFENRNPADTREVVGIFQKSAADDVNAAVAAAKGAYKKWRLVPAPRRAEILFRVGKMLIDKKEDFSREMTREMGKILKETRGDKPSICPSTWPERVVASSDRPPPQNSPTSS